MALQDQNRSLHEMQSRCNIDIDIIYKALRIVPEFNGNSNVLTRFINLCDQLVQTYASTEPGYELINLTLLNGILNKVTGPAARFINSNGIPDTWGGIRAALINNFADQRDETALYNDLALLTQGSKTPQEFYEQCQTLFSTIMTYVTLHENIQTTIEAKRTLYKNLTLQSYLRGLKDPLGSRIRCMRPPTIEKALEYVQEELNILYLQTRNDHLPEKKSWQIPLKSIEPQTQSQKPFTFNMPGPSRPASLPVQNYKMNYSQKTRQFPSRTQQMFAAPPPNYNPHSHMFRLPPQNISQQNLNSPKPMSGVSHFVSKNLPPTNQHGFRYGTQSKQREMNFNECSDDYDNYDYNYYDNQTDCTDHYNYEHCQSPVEQSHEDIAYCETPCDEQNFRKCPKSGRLK